MPQKKQPKKRQRTAESHKEVTSTSQLTSPTQNQPLFHPPSYTYGAINQVFSDNTGRQSDQNITMQIETVPQDINELANAMKESESMDTESPIETSKDSKQEQNDLDLTEHPYQKRANQINPYTKGGTFLIAKINHKFLGFIANTDNENHAEENFTEKFWDVRSSQKGDEEFGIRKDKTNLLSIKLSRSPCGEKCAQHLVDFKHRLAKEYPDEKWIIRIKMATPFNASEKNGEIKMPESDRKSFKKLYSEMFYLRSWNIPKSFGKTTTKYGMPHEFQYIPANAFDSQDNFAKAPPKSEAVLVWKTSKWEQRAKQVDKIIKEQTGFVAQSWKELALTEDKPDEQAIRRKMEYEEKVREKQKEVAEREQQEKRQKEEAHLEKQAQAAEKAMENYEDLDKAASKLEKEVNERNPEQKIARRDDWARDIGLRLELLKRSTRQHSKAINSTFALSQKHKEYQDNYKSLSKKVDTIVEKLNKLFSQKIN